MTFKEKYLQDHPDGRIDGKCPSLFGYDVAHFNDEHCMSMSCSDCWKREMPGTENIKKESKNMRKTKAELEQELIDKQTEILNLNKELENLNRYKKYEDCANELKGALDAMMDAGFTRTEAMSILLASAKM